MLVLTQPDLDRDATLKCSAEYRALGQTQNTIGNGLGLNAASKGGYRADLDVPACGVIGTGHRLCRKAGRCASG